MSPVPNDLSQSTSKNNMFAIYMLPRIVNLLGDIVYTSYYIAMANLQVIALFDLKPHSTTTCAQFGADYVDEYWRCSDGKQHTPPPLNTIYPLYEHVNPVLLEIRVTLAAASHRGQSGAAYWSTPQTDGAHLLDNKILMHAVRRSQSVKLEGQFRG
jgi:hypothetical protein